MSSRRPLEGLIEAPSGTIDTKRYKISTGGKTMILTVFEEHNSLTFYLGGYKVYCVDAQIVKLTPTVFLDEGYLSKVRYDTQCSTLRVENEKEAIFEKGKDTSMILRLMMTYIKNTYPQVKTLTFTDLSTKKCDNGASISLSAMKLFIDGRSWYLPVPEEQEGMQSTGEKYFASGLYEDHFGAKIIPKMEQVYRSIIDDANEKKRQLQWSDFYEYFIINTTPPIETKKIESFYNESQTWQEFFKKIRDDIGVSALCIWFSQNYWFEKAFLKYVKFNLLNFSFLLTIADFSQEYTIEPFTGGWRGVTRKAKRQKVTHRRHRRCRTKSPLTR